MGETESLSQRLKQHRQSYQRKFGGSSKGGKGGKQVVVDCLAWNVKNKSQARYQETYLIQYLKEYSSQQSLISEKIFFERDFDSHHTLFSVKK